MNEKKRLANTLRGLGVEDVGRALRQMEQAMKQKAQEARKAGLGFRAFALEQRAQDYRGMQNE